MENVICKTVLLTISDPEGRLQGKTWMLITAVLFGSGDGGVGPERGGEELKVR